MNESKPTGTTIGVWLLCGLVAIILAIVAVSYRHSEAERRREEIDRKLKSDMQQILNQAEYDQIMRDK